MKDLQKWLQGFSNKTAFFALLLLVINLLTGVTGTDGQTMISAHAAGIMDLAAGILLIGFKIFTPSMQLPKGWTKWFYVSQILLAGVQVAQLLSENGAGLFNELTLHVIGQIQIAATALFAAVQAHNSGGGTPGALATR